MNIVLWIVQILLALMFLMSGSMKAFTYEKAKKSLPWVKDVPKGLVTFIGIVEIAGAISLILPYAFGIAPILTPLAALGIAIIMILAAGLHATRKEMSGVVMNTILLVLALLVFWARL